MDTAKAVLPQSNFRGDYVDPMWRFYHEVLGKPAPPMTATWWFGAPDSGKISRPRKGVVTLISVGSEWSSANQMRGYGRLGRRFGDQFELIIVNNTQGWVRDTAPVLPKDEAEYRYKELQRLFQLPGVMGVYETEYDWLKDGRRSDRSVPQLNIYQNLILVDKQGIVRYVFMPPPNPWPIKTRPDWQWEDAIAQKIAQLIAEENKS
jgi:hypothetical protein